MSRVITEIPRSLPPGIALGNIDSHVVISAETPLALTSFVCKNFSLGRDIDITSLTFHGLQREVVALADDPNLQSWWEKQLATDPALRTHSLQVGMLYEKALSIILGEAASGFSIIGQYHDIGKMLNPEVHELTLFPGRLTPEQYEIIQRHVENAKPVLEREYPLIWAIIAGHHESGQPIPYRRTTIHLDESDWVTRLLLRVLLSACDKADVITSLRSYRTALLPKVVPDKLREAGYSQEIIRAIMQSISAVNEEVPIIQTTCDII